MPRPRRRCRFYDDEGQPLKGGCKREARAKEPCHFAHPSDPDWLTAEPDTHNRLISNSNTSSMVGGRDAGWGGSSRNYASREQARRPPHNSTSAADSGWNTSGWGATSTVPVNTTSTDAEDAWGNDKSKSNTSKDVEPESKGWGVDADAAASSKSTGWGGNDALAESLWGKNVASSWGDNSGWGQDATKANDSSANAPRTSGKSNAWGGTGWGDPSLSSNSVIANAPKVSVDTHPKSSHDKTDPSSLPPPPVSHRPMLPKKTTDVKELSKPVGVARPRINTESLKLVGSPSASPAPSTSMSAVTPGTRSNHGNLTVTSIKAMSRPDVYATIIRTTIKLARAKLELQKAEKDVERWKRTQRSDALGQVRRKGRETLEKLGTKYAKTSKLLLHTVRDLESDLRNLSSLSVPNLEAYATMKMNASMYTAELKEWITDFDGKFAESAETKEEPSTPMVEDKFGDAQKAAVIADMAKVKFADAQSRLQRLTDEVDETSDQLYDKLLFSQFTNIDPNGMVDTHVSRLDEEQEELEESPLEKQVTELTLRVNNLGGRLGIQATSAGELIGTLQKNEKLLSQVKAEKEKNQEMKSELEKQLQDLEQWKTERRKLIDEVSNQVQNLHGFHRPSAQPVALSVESIQPHIQKIVAGIMERELIPALDLLSGECAVFVQKNNDKATRAISVKLHRALETTKQILERAQAQLVVGNPRF